MSSSSARAAPPNPREPSTSESSGSDQSPRTGSFWNRHRRAVATAVAALVGLGLVYYVLPRAIGLGPTIKRLRQGDLWWLALGVLFEAGSMSGDTALLRGVFSAPDERMSWRSAWQITLAGAAATKLFAAAGAGGIAVWVWALRGFGYTGGAVARGMVCFEVITYSVYMVALMVGGLGLWFGLFSGPAPLGVTLIPALLGALVIVVVLAMAILDEPAERFLLRRAERSTGRLSGWLRAAAALPRSLRGGLDGAATMLKRRDPSLLGALATWGFDIATLWACFRAFGHSPPGAVLVMGYYIGTLGNALPLPGGVGGVEGGMIGAFIAFGVSSHLAVLAVLAYRTISYWLPTIPGAIAYFQLRHRLDAEEAPSS